MSWIPRRHTLLIHDRSKHDSPNFGNHYSAEQVAEIFAPSQDTVDTVRGWLEAAGIASHRVSQSVNKQWLQFDAKAKEVEGLLKTKYHVYEHTATGKANIACEQYHVPEAVQEHVDYITPGIKLFATGGKGAARHDPKKYEKRTFGVTGSEAPLPPLKKPMPISITEVKNKLASNTTNPELALCDVVVSPACIRAFYNVTKPTKAAKGNQLGIFEDLGDVYSQEDLDEFFKALAPEIPQGTHPELRAIDGAVAPVPVTEAGAESDLDFQISYPLIYPQNTVLFQTDDPVYEANYTFEGFLNNFLDAIDGSYCSYSAYGEKGNSPLDPPYPDPNPGGYKGKLQCGVYKPTNVVSISYGGQEADLPASYQKRQCNEYLKLGLQGVSIFISSGDSGVAGPAGDDSSNGCLGGGKIFSPDFPASCPYVSTLGATFLPPGGSAERDEEVAVTRFPSGGGFSNIYGIPEYQKRAVNNYFTKHNPPYPYYRSINNASFGANGGIYNRIGRGYPDFAAVGDNVAIFNMGTPVLIGGTSASSPVFAALINRVNEERIARGKRTVGFVNPTLYAHPHVFHDITVGSNPGCGTDGFAVASGWDPVTGLGTPNYPALLKLYLSLP
jgi:tripeptidyl-peptidase-1